MHGTLCGEFWVAVLCQVSSLVAGNPVILHLTSCGGMAAGTRYHGYIIRTFGELQDFFGALYLIIITVLLCHLDSKYMLV